MGPGGGGGGWGTGQQQQRSGGGGGGGGKNRKGPPSTHPPSPPPQKAREGLLVTTNPRTSPEGGVQFLGTTTSAGTTTGGLLLENIIINNNNNMSSSSKNDDDDDDNFSIERCPSVLCALRAITALALNFGSILNGKCLRQQENYEDRNHSEMSLRLNPVGGLRVLKTLLALTRGGLREPVARCSLSAHRHPLCALMPVNIGPAPGV